MGDDNRPITISSNTMEEPSSTPTYTPATLLFWKNHQIVNGGLGMGKAVIPPLMVEERKELRESLGSSTTPPSI